MSKYKPPDGCRNLWLMVSDDGYELPMVVADSAGELARMLGITEATIYHQISNARKHGYFCRYVKVRVEL